MLYRKPYLLLYKSLVMFNFLHSLVQGFLAVAQFVVVVGASLIIGILTGMAGSLFTRFTAHVHGK